MSFLVGRFIMIRRRSLEPGDDDKTMALSLPSSSSQKELTHVDLDRCGRRGRPWRVPPPRGIAYVVEEQACRARGKTSGDAASAHLVEHVETVPSPPRDHHAIELAHVRHGVPPMPSPPIKRITTRRRTLREGVRNAGRFHLELGPDAGLWMIRQRILTFLFCPQTNRV